MRRPPGLVLHSTFNIQHSTFPWKGVGLMLRLPRVFSRISLRLMLFNALLVFLPVAGFLLLGTYEQHLERAQIEAMFHQARLVVAMMQSGGSPRFDPEPGDTRYRLLDPPGRATSHSGAPP